MAARFDADLYAALEPYHALAGGMQAEQAPSQPGEADETGLEALRQENERLSEELRITMETMSRMLNEYSTMFSGEPPEDTAATDESSADDVPFDTVDHTEEVPADEFDTADEVAESEDAGEFEVVAGDDEDLFAEDSAAMAPEPEPAAVDTDQDPMQQVIREAAMREQLARDAGDAVEVSVKTRPAGSSDDRGLDDVAIDVAGNTDPSTRDVDETAAEGVPAVDDLDDLFDAGDDSLKAGSGS